MILIFYSAFCNVPVRQGLFSSLSSRINDHRSPRALAGSAIIGTANWAAKMTASFAGIFLTEGSFNGPVIRTGELRLNSLLLDSGLMTISTVSEARLIDPNPRARTPGVSR